MRREYPEKGGGRELSGTRVPGEGRVRELSGTRVPGGGGGGRELSGTRVPGEGRGTGIEWDESTRRREGDGN